MGESRERVAFIPDLHFPYHDKKAVAAAEAFLWWFKPRFVWLLGDACDFYQPSNYDRNPARVYELQGDIDGTFLLIHRLREAAAKATWWYVEGNHERRMRKRLWRKLPEGASLRCLDVEKLLSVESLGINYVSEGVTEWRGLIVKHGHFVRGKGAYSAAAEMDRTWASGVSAHTHRLGLTHYAGFRHKAQWMECGCLSQIKQEWHEGQHMNQRHGLGFGWVSSKGNAELHAVPIENGRLFVMGEEIRG